MRKKRMRERKQEIDIQYDMSEMSFEVLLLLFSNTVAPVFPLFFIQSTTKPGDISSTHGKQLDNYLY